MREKDEILYILIVGNVVDGIDIIGPFDSHDSATEYAESDHHMDNWEICMLQAPAWESDNG